MEALANVMNVIGTLDQGIIKAIKNSSVIRWLLIAKSAVRPDDLKKNVQDLNGCGAEMIDCRCGSASF